MNLALKKKIDDFLKPRRRSDGGGWAKITTDDVTQLEDIVQALIKAKCHPDDDGDRPIEFMIINRRTHHSMPYCALPYDAWIRGHHDDEDDLPQQPTDDEIMDLAMLNLELATNDVNRMYRLRRSERMHTKNEPEKSQAKAPAGPDAGSDEV